MSDDEGRFRFFSMDEMWLVSGESLEFLNRARGRFGGDRPVLFWHPGDDSYHLLAGSEVPDLAELLGDPDFLQVHLSRRRAEIVGRAATPEELAVVLDDDGLVIGAWLEPDSDQSTPRVSEGRSRSLDLVGMDPGVQRAADLGMAIPAAATPPEPVGEPVIRRTPHLDVPDSIPTTPGSLIEVVVRTDRHPFKEAEEGADVVIEAPPEVTEIELDVQLSVSDHFEVEGEDTMRLSVRRDEDDSEPVRFSLRVSERPPERTAGICALFTYRRRPCGHVIRAWRWSNTSPQAPTAPAHTALPASLPVHVDTVPPDVVAYITAPVNDGTRFRCAVETTLVPGFAKPKPKKFGLREKAPAMIARLLGPLSDDSLDAIDRREALAEAGYELWEAAPPVFKKAIWKLADDGHLGCSIFIASAEPSLPWELMIPTRQDGKEPDELRPLGVEFAIGRWSRGDAASPPQRIPVRNTFVIAPEYEDDPLESADEVEFVERHLKGTKVHDATKRGLDQLFANQHASVLHFVCHGVVEEVENDEAIYLDGEEKLRSRALRPLAGFKALCKARAPLVFINACDAGVHQPSLAGGAGFPRAFGDIGARAVLAPLWPVKDVIATKVARTIYEEALQPGAKPVAEILRSIRARAYAEDDADTYAAYAFFGDPLATLELVTH